MKLFKFSKTTLVLISVLIANALHGQRALTTEDLLKHTLYFGIGDGFTGAGASLLNEEIGKAQFIAYGELHNSQQSALFFNDLLQEANKRGFDKLALEVGPHSAEIISRLIADAQKAQEQLRGFHKAYGSSTYKVPIPFIKGEEDALFLESASELSFDIWGLDQEYTFGAPPLFDALLMTLQAPDESIIKIKEEATKAWKKLKKKESNCLALTSPEIETYFSQFDGANKQAQSIIASLKTSWEIYCHHHRQEYDQNNSKRIAYMRGNLQTHIDRLTESTGQMPKVIAKMGSYHTTRIKSPIGYQDVGHLLATIAEERKVQSLHIRYLRRFWRGKDMLDSDSYANSRLFLTVGKRDEWAVIDLRPFRKMIRDGEVTATNWQKFEIFNYDLMLMAPEDDRVKNNF